MISPKFISLNFNDNKIEAVSISLILPFIINSKIIDDFSKDEKIKEILNIFPESKIEEVKKEGENNE